MPFELTFNTDRIDEEYRAEYVRNIFAPIAKVFPLNESNICTSGQIRRIHSVILVNLKAEAYRYERSKELVWQSNLDMYLLTIALEGGHFHCGEDHEVLNIMDGDIALVDLSKQAHGVTNKGNHLQIYIPKEILKHRLDGFKIQNDILLKSNKPMTKILKDYMLGLFDVAVRLQEKEASITLYTFLSLLVTALKSVSPQKLLYLNENTKGGEVLKHRVYDFIDLNIKSADLGVEVLMKNFRVSRAHLYRAFEEDGGVVSVIRNKRLDMAYHELLDPLNNSTVTQIAYEYGFSNSNQFYRAFRQKYGFGPNEIKRNQGKFNLYLNTKNGLYQHFKMAIKQ
ncbi:helix-turn-helix domain-containing protein [Acinetobacter nosocomialis]|uniref:helix-turn-helix domain-containing protein n=1 Tax=Acinetobacter nosocomialis TaxID=106654 RepID=UPI00124C81BB|nr:helix-turn-helix domain-containing protein [Acinetobacter nosocomialis]